MSDILPGIPRVLVPYDEYRRVSQNADIALWEPRSLVGKLIADGTGGPFCHVTGIVWFDGRIWHAGYEERKDGSLTQVSASVRRFPGKISIFRLKDYDALERVGLIAKHLVCDLGGDYAWNDIRLNAFSHALVGKLLLKIPIVKARYEHWLKLQTQKHTSADCSQHIHRSFRTGAGVWLSDAVRRCEMLESLVSPNDIAQSDKLKYLGTLTWPEGWKR